MHRHFTYFTLPIVATTLVLLSAGVTPARAESEPDATSWYDFAIKATPSVTKGGKGSVTVQITPKGTAEIHKEAPIKLSLQAPANVELSKTVLGRKEVKMDGNNASFDVPFTANDVGKGDIEATVSFFICTDKICARQERKATLPVAVR
jgi:hypothetical protein